MEDYSIYKTKLEAERDKLASELSDLGIQDSHNTEHWDLKQPDLEVMHADQNEAADRTEEAHIDSIVLNELGARYHSVLHALTKFDDGTYGTCEVSGERIEKERLDANPAASTCMQHLGDVD